MDSVDSPMAGEAPKRPTALCLPPQASPLQDRWLVFNVTFGVPLFNAELNQEIIHKLVTKGLVRKDSTEQMSRRYAEMGADLITFVRSVMLSGSVLDPRIRIVIILIRIRIRKPKIISRCGSETLDSGELSVSSTFLLYQY